MARALEQILQELDSVYNPQKDVYNKQIAALPGMQQAELGGLEQSKKDSFNQITQGANRRGVAFGGIPLGEQAEYLGSTYLPAVANLKGRFASQKSDLALRLAELAAKQRQDAYGIRDFELAEDARREEAAAAARASAGGGGGGTSYNPFGEIFNGYTNEFGQGNGPLTRRQQWQQQANQGDYEAQTALNYLDDNGRYDGPVNTTYEYNILKKLGAQGNFYNAETAAKDSAKKAVNVVGSKTSTGTYGPFSGGYNNPLRF